MGSFQPFPPVQTWPQVAQRKGPCTDFAKRLKAKSFKICSGLNKKKKMSIQRDKDHSGHYSLGAPNSTKGPQSNLADFSCVNWTPKCLVGCWIY